MEMEGDMEVVKVSMDHRIQARLEALTLLQNEALPGPALQRTRRYKTSLGARPGQHAPRAAGEDGADGELNRLFIELFPSGFYHALSLFALQFL